MRFWAWKVAFWLQLDHWVDNVMGRIKLMTTIPTLQRLNTAASLGIPLARNTRWENRISDLRHIYTDRSYWYFSFSKPTPRSFSKPFSTKDTYMSQKYILSFISRKEKRETPFQDNFHEKIGLFNLTAFNVRYFGQNCISS